MVPIAIIASILAGCVGFYLGRFWSGMEWMSWASGGALSAVAFLYVGMKIAPRKTKTGKWTMIGIVVVIGLLSGVGSILGDKPISALSGLAMIVVGLAFSGTTPEEIAE